MKNTFQLLSLKPLTPCKDRTREICLEERKAFKNNPSPESSDPNFLAAIELRKDIETREALIHLLHEGEVIATANGDSETEFTYSAVKSLKS